MKQSMTGHLTRFFEAACLDLPLAAAQRWSSGDSRSLRTAGWAAYDSFVALANEMTNALYANPIVGSSFGRAVEAAFHAQHLLDAFAPGLPAEAPALTVLEAAAAEDSQVSPYAIDGIAEAAPRITLATRGAHFAEAATQYRRAAQTRPPRRAAA